MNLSGEMRVDVESGEDHDVLAIPRSANPRSSISRYSRGHEPSHSGASGRLSYRRKPKSSKNRFHVSSSRTPTPYSDSDNADSDNYSTNHSDEDSNFFSRSNSKKDHPLGTYYESSSPNHHSSRLHENLPYANNILTNSLSSSTPRRNYPNQIKTNAFINYNVNPDDPDDEIALNRQSTHQKQQQQGTNANSKSATVKTNGVNHNGIGFYSKVMPTPPKIHNNSDLFHETDLNAIISIPNSTPAKGHYTRNGKLPNHANTNSVPKNKSQNPDDYVDFIDSRYQYGLSNGVIPIQSNHEKGNSSAAHSSRNHNNPSFNNIDTDGKAVTNNCGKRNGDKNGGSGNSHNGRGSSTAKKNKKAPSASKPLPSNLEPPAQWKLRLKTSVIFVSALLLIFSCSSLLFIFPIIVDPIVFGLQAQFSAEPAQCRTVSYRNETGTGNCSEPSCREGCTVDLYSCFFIMVEYQIGFYEDIPSVGNFSDLNSSSTLSPLHSRKKYFKPTNDEIKVATLRVNPNGCGYPPDVICSEFNQSFGALDTTFPCYYSHLPIANDSIAVVPFYNRETELMTLSVALGIPLAVVVISAGLLFITIRWHPRAQRRKERKKGKKSSNEEFDNVPDLPGSSSSSDAILQPRQSSGLNHTHNGFIPKANGHIEKTVSGLMGFNAMQLSGQPDSKPLYEKNLSTVPSSSTGNRNGKIKT